MDNISIYSLYSGSKGNSTYIRSGDDEILIDAGKSATCLCRALTDIGTDISNIKAIFITHEHSDHINALEVLSKKHSLPIHITDGSARKIVETSTYAKQNLKIHTPLFKMQIGDMKVSSFCTPHDSEMSVGYTIDFESGEKFGYATDIGHVSEEVCENLLGSDAVIIESNHEINMLMNGPYPQWLKSRILSGNGHLSNDACAAFLPKLIESGTKHIMLAHLSAENNQPDIALQKATDVCVGASVIVAKEAMPTRLI